MNTEPKMNPPPTIITHSWDFPAPEISQDTQEVITQLFKNLERQAFNKIRQEYDEIDKHIEYSKHRQKLRDIRAVGYDIEHQGCLLEERMINKWNVDFQKRMKNGYYIQDDCWNIIKMFVFDYTIIGHKKLRRDTTKLRLGWYIRFADMRNVFTKVSFRKLNGAVYYDQNNKKHERKRKVLRRKNVFIKKLATNENVVSNLLDEPNQYEKWNLKKIEAIFYEVVKINKKSIKINVYKYYFNPHSNDPKGTHVFLKLKCEKSNGMSDFEPMLCRINKNHLGEQNYKTDYYRDYMNFSNHNNGCFNLNDLVRLGVKSRLNHIFPKNIVMENFTHAVQFTTAHTLWKRRYLELEPLYKKMFIKKYGEKEYENHGKYNNPARNPSWATTES